MANILLIDDEPSMRLLYSDLRADEGHQVLKADSGSDTLNVIEKCPPDLVLPDIKLRSENGLTLLQEMVGRYPRLPVLLLTAFASFQDDTLRWLADGYLLKATDPTGLLSEVNRVLRKGKNCLTGGERQEM